MSEEIERKYLVLPEAWRPDAQRGERILQGYLSTDPDRSVRVRIQGAEAFLTVKGKAEGPSRSEFEYPIPAEDARVLLDQLCVKPLIDKTRYEVACDGLAWTVDEFENENSGLVLAEVETASPEPPQQKPAWVTEEVTGDDRYKNVNLVSRPYSQWRSESRKPETKFHLKPGESVRKGFRRIVCEQLDLAIAELSDYSGSLEQAVHEARKAMKRVRSTLRLSRSVLGDAYDRENKELQSAGQKLSPLRDAHALVGVFDDLIDQYPDRLDDARRNTVRGALLKRRQEMDQQFTADGQLIAEVLDVLHAVRVRAPSLPLEHAGIDVVTEGVEQAVLRGRKLLRQAYAEPCPENFHEWRKRAKDLRYFMELLHKLWPPVLDGYQESAKTLEQLLGEDHNLAVLRDAVLQTPGEFGSEEEAQTLLSVIDDYQEKLRREARTLGQRIYGEKPAAWARRLRTSWKASRQEAS